MPVCSDYTLSLYCTVPLESNLNLFLDVFEVVGRSYLAASRQTST